MTDNEIRIAIAEACGWTVLDKPDLSGPCACYARDNRGELRCGIPDYPNDLNAMHEAEKVLTDVQREEYAAHLLQYDIYPDNSSRWSCAHTPARQRAEAFLRTIGKWKD